MQCRNEKLIMLAKSRSSPSQQTPQGAMASCSWLRGWYAAEGKWVEVSGQQSSGSLPLTAMLCLGAVQWVQNSSGRAHWRHKTVGARFGVSRIQPAGRCCLGSQARRFPPVDACLGLPFPVTINHGPLTVCTCIKGDCCGFGVTPGRPQPPVLCIFSSTVMAQTTRPTPGIWSLWDSFLGMIRSFFKHLTDLDPSPVSIP